MNRLLSIAAVLAVAGLGFLYLSTQRAPEDPFSITADAQESGDIDTSGVVDMSLGNPDADVTVIEYASYTCPHCRAFHEDSYDEFKADYIDTGKVHFIYREVYFDRFGLWAGMLARCGGEERFFGIVDLIYEGQRDWLGTGDPTEIANNLRRLGRTAGLSDDQVNACLQDRDMAQAMVAVYQENATRDGVQSTPSFLVNGTLVSGNNWGELKSAIDGELGS